MAKYSNSPGNGITLDEYLANHSTNRHIDNVIKKWFHNRNGHGYVEKTKEEWDKIVSEFLTETTMGIETKPEIKEPITVSE